MQINVENIDLEKKYGSVEEELHATKEYLYQLVNELKYRFGRIGEDDVPEAQGTVTDEQAAELASVSYNMVQTKGINADWIKAGRLSSKQENVVFDLDAGTLKVDSHSESTFTVADVNRVGVIVFATTPPEEEEP